MIESRADGSGRSEEDAGPRPRPRDGGIVRRRLKFRRDASSLGMSLSSISKLASSTSPSEWIDEERRLDSSSTKVPSSRTVSASNVVSASEELEPELELELDNSELVMVLVLLVLLVLVVGEGKGAMVLNGSWCWW